MNLSGAAVDHAMFPVDNFDRGIAFYRDAPGIRRLTADRDGTRVVLMSGLAIPGV